VDLTFGSSGAMAAQIRAGAPIDVLVAADERIVADLSRDAFVIDASLRTVARNRLVVLQRSQLPARVASVDDLRRPDIDRIAIPDESVPLGAYTRAWLQRENVLAAVEDRIVPTAHARATLSAVENGDVDVAVVYATAVRLAQNARVAFRVDPSRHPPIRYAAVRVAGSRQTALAERFVAFLGSEVARSELRAAGFEDP